MTTSQLNQLKLTTQEVSAALKVRPQTILKGLCQNGHYQGLRPVKMPNRYLLWDAAAVQKLINGEGV